MAPKKKQEGRETYYSALTGRINYRFSQGHQYTKQFKLHRDEMRQEYKRVRGGRTPYNYRLMGEFLVTDLYFDQDEETNTYHFMHRGGKNTKTREFWGFHEGNWTMPATPEMNALGKWWANYWSGYEHSVKFVKVLSVSKCDDLERFTKFVSAYFDVDPLRDSLLPTYEVRRSQDHATVREEAHRERIMINSYLAQMPMFGTATLSLFGASNFSSLENLCVPEYLTRHLTRTDNLIELGTVLRHICLNDEYLSCVLPRAPDSSAFQTITNMLPRLLQATAELMEPLHNPKRVIDRVTEDMKLLVQLVGTCSTDLVPIAEKYHCSVYLVDVNGSVFYAYRPSTETVNSHVNAIVGVTYNNHLYPIECENTSIRASIIQRFIRTGEFANQKSNVDLCNRKRHVHAPEPPKKKGPGRPSFDEVWKAKMVNSAIEPLLDPSMEDLLEPENANKYICFTCPNINDVYDFLVRNDRVCQGGLTGGRSLTRWRMAQGRKICSQIQTSTQLITRDPFYTVNVVLHKYYGLEKEFSALNLGSWFFMLFDGEVRMTTESRVPGKTPTGPCALCPEPAVEIDHIVPLSRGGSNEPENLQGLCKACNNEKSDKLTGVALPPFNRGSVRRGCGKPIHMPYTMDSLRSEFNENMQKMLYTDKGVWGVPSFRTERAYVTRDELSVLRSEVQILGFDCDKQYSTCLYKNEHAWMRFSLFDCIEPFNLIKDRITPGYYRIVDFADPRDPSWEGPGGYPHVWVIEHHHNGTLRPSDVPEVLRASAVFPPQLFQAVVRELYRHDPSISKKMANFAVGLCDCVETNNVRDHIVTPSLQEIYHYTLMNLGQNFAQLGSEVKVEKCQRDNMGDFYEMTAESTSTRSKLLRPISDQVRATAAIWASRMYRKHFLTGPQKIVAVYKDQLIFTTPWGPGGEEIPPSVLVDLPIGSAPFDWTYSREDPKWDMVDRIFDAAPDIPVTGVRVHTYDTRTSVNKDYPDLVKAIQTGKSVCILGAAGTGKTFVARKALKGRGGVLAPTNSAARVARGDGVTFHRFFGFNSKMPPDLSSRSSIPSPLWVDEGSMVSGQMWRALYDIHRQFGEGSDCPNPVQIICTGDPDQCLPVEPHSQLMRGEETYLEDVPCIMDMFSLKYTLGYNHRSDDEPEWVRVCDLLRAGSPWTPSVTMSLENLLEKDLERPKVVCYHNVVRLDINKKMAQIWKEKIKTREVTGQYCIGMPVVCKVNDPDGHYSNNDPFSIRDADDTAVYLQRDGPELVMPLADFCEKFQLAFAITVDCAQSKTFDWTYAVHEFADMDRRRRYTAFSRCRKLEQCVKLLL